MPRPVLRIICQICCQREPISDFSDWLETSEVAEVLKTRWKFQNHRPLALEWRTRIARRRHGFRHCRSAITIIGTVSELIIEESRTRFFSSISVLGQPRSDPMGGRFKMHYRSLNTEPEAARRMRMATDDAPSISASAFYGRFGNALVSSRLGPARPGPTQLQTGSRDAMETSWTGTSWSYSCEIGGE